MGRINDLSLQLEERGVPDFVYQEASVGDALRLLGQDHVRMAKVNGRWAIVQAIPVEHRPTKYLIPVSVL